MIINRQNGLVMDRSLGDTKENCEVGVFPTIRKPMDTSIKVTSDPEGESMTHQSFREETDINKIMDRFQRTGQLPPAKYKEPQYLDVSSLNAPLNDVINQTERTLTTTREFINENEKTKKKAAEKAARDAADAASKQTQGATPETGAPQKTTGGPTHTA